MGVLFGALTTGVLMADLLSHAGDRDKSKRPVATFFPADAHPVYVQRLWDGLQSSQDNTVVLDIVVSCWTAIFAQAASLCIV